MASVPSRRPALTLFNAAPPAAAAIESTETGGSRASPKTPGKTGHAQQVREASLWKVSRGSSSEHAALLLYCGATSDLNLSLGGLQLTSSQSPRRGQRERAFHQTVDSVSFSGSGLESSQHARALYLCSCVHESVSVGAQNVGTCRSPGQHAAALR